jgi:hypothetical protein
MLNIVTLLTTLVAGPLACTLDTNGLAKPAPYAINHNLNVKLPAYIFVYIDAIMAKHYWLLKTEPSTFSIQDLEKAPKKTTFWEGVRITKPAIFSATTSKWVTMFLFITPIRKSLESWARQRLLKTDTPMKANTTPNPNTTTPHQHPKNPDGM